MRIKPPPGGKHHRVKEGEWVGSITMQYGFADWEKVWTLPENAELKDRRPDPRVLAPDDELFIPELEEKKESGSTEQKHRFRLKVPVDVLRLRLVDDDGKPLENQPYVLEITTASRGGAYKQKNTKTDGDGVLCESLPIDALKGTLILTELEQTTELSFGHLDPLDSDNETVFTRAVQQRLTFLGFDPGPIDGKAGPLTETGVRALQQFLKDSIEEGSEDSRVTDPGPVDGIVGPKTKEALLKYYGC